MGVCPKALADGLRATQAGAELLAFRALRGPWRRRLGGCLREVWARTLKSRVAHMWGRAHKPVWITAGLYRGVLYSLRGLGNVARPLWVCTCEMQEFGQFPKAL